MKGLIVLANGFEDVEAIATIDILKRAQVNLNVVSLHHRDHVVSSHNNKIIVDKCIRDINYTEYDYLVLPGGPAVFDQLEKSKFLSEVIKHFCENKKLVCAICAAPKLIGRYGYFKDLEYTCFPGCNENIEGVYVETPVVHSKNYITARSMYYTNDFALEIVSTIKGNEKAVEIARQIKGL